MKSHTYISLNNQNSLLAAINQNQIDEQLN